MLKLLPLLLILLVGCEPTNVPAPPLPVEASEAIKRLGESAAKVPLLDRKTLRLILMNAYRREWGPLRFFHPGWWDAFLSR